MTISTLNSENQGKKASFLSLIKDDQIKIEIPIIQRDYAQGRESATDIRNQFVETIFEHLNSRTNLHLDFIYGDVKQENDDILKLIPLDGQQRLTTLFLIHWYFAKKEGYFEEFQNLLAREGHIFFSYETRISSRDFCKALLTEELEFDPNKDINAIIRDKNWFFYSWEKDATIKSMLEMLKTVQHLDREQDGDIEFYPLLANTENPLLSFQFIELKDFGLTESLYIKMNARGKALTTFENFKAKLEQILEERSKENGDKLYNTFTSNIDTEWTDFFWNFRNEKTNLFDDEFMNLSAAIFCNSLANEDAPRIDSIRYLQNNRNPINYYIFKNHKCFDNQGLKDLIDILSLVQKKGEQVFYLSNKDIVNEKELIHKGVRNSFTYIERLQFFALYEYLRFNETSTGIENWMRVVRNLTESTNYDEAGEFQPSIHALRNMLSESSEIIAFLSNSPELKSFAGIQIQEEYIKAQLIRNWSDWEEPIKQVENHPYFKGQIGFLLDFSGVLEYYEEHESVVWSEEENDLFFESFVSYSKKAQYIFEANGLRGLEDFVFERALLSVGDYTLKKKSNYSFLINGFDREISWKRLLRNPTKQRNFVKELFDKLDVELDLSSQLDSIIANSEVNDWRKYMVYQPGIITACGKQKFFRFNTDQNILLLQRSQTNGAHTEYYSYSLYLKLKELGIPCNYHEDNSVEEDKYVYNINYKSYQVYFCPQDDNDEIYEYQVWKNYNTCEFKALLQTEVMEFIQQEILDSK